MTQPHLRESIEHLDQAAESIRDSARAVEIPVELADFLARISLADVRSILVNHLTEE